MTKASSVILDNIDINNHRWMCVDITNDLKVEIHTKIIKDFSSMIEVLLAIMMI